MSIEIKIANHTCNVIRRHIKSAFPDFDAIFIVHGENGRKKAFHNDTHKIMEHPAGRHIIDNIRKDTDLLNRQRSCFVGIAKEQTPGFLGFFRSSHIAAIFFINHERFSTEENLRNHALHLVWHALILIREHSKNSENGFIKPDYTDIMLQHTNLTADIFSASFQQLEGKKDVFDNLINLRIKNTLAPEKGFIAENFPFPICLETLEIVLEDQFEQSGKKARPVSESAKIADEIGMTYKTTSILQWASFAKPAQEMAWCGFDKETILGCAIYSSENTYIRSIADMVAERLNIRPAIITSTNDYNPFTESEANERLHNRRVQENLRAALGKIYSAHDYSILLKEAKAQNQRLLNGNPIGWASSALIAGAHSVKAASPNTIPEDIRVQAENVFELINKAYTYETLRSFVQIIFKSRREGHVIDREFLSSDIFQDAKYTEILTAITQIWDIDQVNPIDKMKTQNISSFISPNTLKS